MRIFVGVPAYGHMIYSDVCSAMLRELEEVQKAGHTIQFFFSSAPLVSTVRNRLVLMAKKWNADYLLFWDADVVPLENQSILMMLEAMKEKDAAVCGANYRLKFPDGRIIYAAARFDGNTAKNLTDTDLKLEIMDCNFVPTGFMLIDMKKCEGLEDPWFRFFDLPKGGVWPEDWEFCLSCINAHLKVILDARIRTLHCGLAYYQYPTDALQTIGGKNETFK